MLRDEDGRYTSTATKRAQLMEMQKTNDKEINE
jgi:hypothetical protein